jgi:hypothetical protein
MTVISEVDAAGDVKYNILYISKHYIKNILFFEKCKYMCHTFYKYIFLINL